MADVLVTFEDGTTELRPANSPAHFHPVRRLRGDVLGPGDYETALDGRWLTIARMRGQQAVSVWRETGVRAEGKPLTGEWRACRVETVEEQIERLTLERDAAMCTIRHALDLWRGGRDPSDALRAALTVAKGHTT